MAEHVSNNNFISSESTILPSRINRFIEDFTAELELRAARVAAGYTPSGEIERQFQTILEMTRSEFPARLSTLQQNMAKPMALYRNTRKFATFAHLDLRESGALESVDLAEKHRATVSPFASTWVHIPPMVDGLINLERLRDAIIPQAGYTGLKFYVSKVQCVEETDGWGSDEIYLGGNFVDETGEASYHWFRVSNDFDTGEIKDYGFPGKQLQYFNLTEGGNKFPKIYTAALTMVEEDWGNMSGWFKDLFEKVKAKVKDLLKKLGYAVGELIGIGALGSLIGEIFAGIFEWLVNWIVQLFENDYMGTFTTQATINSYTGNWVSTGGPLYSWSKKFKAHGGHYHVWYVWELVK